MLADQFTAKLKSKYKILYNIISHHLPYEKLTAGTLVATVVVVPVGSLPADPTYKTEGDTDGHQQQDATDRQAPVVSVLPVIPYIIVHVTNHGIDRVVNLFLKIRDDARYIVQILFDRNP